MNELENKIITAEIEANTMKTFNDTKVIFELDLYDVMEIQNYTGTDFNIEKISEEIGELEYNTTLSEIESEVERLIVEEINIANDNNTFAYDITTQDLEFIYSINENDALTENLEVSIIGNSKFITGEKTIIIPLTIADEKISIPSVQIEDNKTLAIVLMSLSGAAILGIGAFSIMYRRKGKKRL